MGWISTERISNSAGRWLAQWYNCASEVEDENYELVVFKLPKNQLKASDTLISEIEYFLQQKLDNNGST